MCWIDGMCYRESDFVNTTNPEFVSEYQVCIPKDPYSWSIKYGYEFRNNRCVQDNTQAPATLAAD